MKNKAIIASKRDGFEGQYKKLSISQMMNLRGGDTPPPDPPNDDYPIKPTLATSFYTSVNVSIKSMPVLKTKMI